jgi:hypothetical protein
LFLSERLYSGLVAPNRHPNRHLGGCRFTYSPFFLCGKKTFSIFDIVILNNMLRETTPNGDQQFLEALRWASLHNTLTSCFAKTWRTLAGKSVIVRRFPPTIRLARLVGEGQRYATNSDTQIAPKFVWANLAELHHNNALIF